MKTQIKQISYPNTVCSDVQGHYTEKSGYSFERFNKNGEMASIGWIRIIKDGSTVAELKESICDIYFT